MAPRGGTVEVIDLWVGGSSQPRDLLVFDGLLFFRADDGSGIGAELWATDGTAAGTYLVADIETTPGLSSYPSALRDLDGTLVFLAQTAAAGYELWTSDGTAAGTQIVLDIMPGPANANVSPLAVIGDRLYFGADDGVTGRELWVTDGTAAGTVQVADMNAGPGHAVAGAAHAWQGNLYFRAYVPAYGNELWTLTLNEPPVASCQDITVPAVTGCDATAVATDFDDGTIDPDGHPLVFTVDPSGPYSAGATDVTITVEDPFGMSDTCDATITVTDSGFPTITCPADISMPSTIAGGEVVSFSVTATDDCDPSPTIVCVPASGSIFPVGTTTVTCTATDSSGNEATCAFNVELTSAGGGQRPGDCNQDGGIDLGDAICLLNYLFLGTPAVLPCGDGTPADPGNLAVYSVNGDGSIDLADPVYLIGYLFLGDPPPVLGTSCMTIAGCPPVCTP